MGSVVTDIVAPCVGLVTANLLFLSPMKDIHGIAASRNKSSINVFPTVMLPINCLAWVFYSFVLQGTTLSALLVFFTNFPGFLIGCYYCALLFCTMEFKPPRLRMVLSLLGVGFIANFFGLMICSILLKGDDSAAARQSLMGSIGVAILVVFYSSPLLTLVDVIKTRDSSSFSVPLAATTSLNGFVWAIFGLFVGDYFIWAPNLLGLCNGLIQLICCGILPRRAGEVPLLEVKDINLKNLPSDSPIKKEKYEEPLSPVPTVMSDSEDEGHDEDIGNLISTAAHARKAKFGKVETQDSGEIPQNDKSEQQDI